MNEILARKYLKEVMKHGIPKHIAKEIVETALDASNGKNPIFAIKYGMDLKYGLGFTKTK